MKTDLLTPEFYLRHNTGAEFIQTEEAQANSITQYVGDRINAFIGGILFCLVSEIALHLLGSWF